MGKSYRPVLLECEHTLYFRATYEPSPGETLWCKSCDAYSKVPVIEAHRPTYFPDGNWNCYRITTNLVKGICRDCGHEYKGKFVTVRSHMEKHNDNGCISPDRFGTIALPPNSPPPF